ncbi:MAG TPA: DUF3592 domain-containing protein, partial [Amycolatopsis sp.]|nr:DUF3592 domain-containing protein [Amycolatopsis sp.]
MLSVLVFLVFAVGTTYSLLATGYRFEDGELATDIEILAGSLVLSIVTGWLAARFGRTVPFTMGTQTWLPPADEADTGDDQTGVLRVLARRSARLSVVWLLVLAAGLSGVLLEDKEAQRLLDAGTQVHGTVLKVFNPVKGTRSIDVGYFAAGDYRRATINRDSGWSYAVGDGVTVVYDPGDPTRVRTTEEANTADPDLVFGFVILLGLAGLVVCRSAVKRWRTRYNAVSATGWRDATADIGGQSGRKPLRITVRFRDGSLLRLHEELSTHTTWRYSGAGELPVRVGGDGRSMVLLFQPNSLRDKPFPVPVT